MKVNNRGKLNFSKFPSFFVCDPSFTYSNHQRFIWVLFEFFWPFSYIKKDQFSRDKIISGSKGAPARGSKFFHFHAVFGKNLKNNSNFGSCAPPWGKSWICHWRLIKHVVWIQNWMNDKSRVKIPHNRLFIKHKLLSASKDSRTIINSVPYKNFQSKRIFSVN